MRCLRCWKDINTKTAIYTKSCNHVFCEDCSSSTFSKELACPLCDTVLPKDGIGEVNLQPDNSELRRVASKIFGFEPNEMCDVLQLALQFWAKQKQNESLKYNQDVKSLRKKLDEAEELNEKLSKSLDDERLKKKSLQSEKESLQSLVTELETRYAEKARSLRKLSELYNELRQVHRRLEVDLRGVRDKAGFDEAVVGERGGRSEVEVQTVERSRNRERRVESGWRDVEVETTERIGLSGLGTEHELENENGDGIEMRREVGRSSLELERRTRRLSDAPNSGRIGRANVDGLFTIAQPQVRAGRPAFEIAERARRGAGRERRRRERRFAGEGEGEYGEVGNRMSKAGRDGR